MSQARITLIDADSLIWIAAWNFRESKTIAPAISSLDEMIIEILRNTKAEGYCGFLQGPIKSPRHTWFPDYKANRPVKPEWYNNLVEPALSYLVRAWKFELVNGMESDDAVASALHIIANRGEVPIICSGDKDLDQLVGEHYNPKKKETYFIDSAQGFRNWCMQLLTGDATDNVKGIVGVGPVKAAKILGEEIKGDNLYRIIEAYIINAGETSIGITDFAESALKLTLRTDVNFQFSVNNVPPNITKQEIETVNIKEAQ